MKRLLCIFLAAVLCFSLASCSVKDDTSETTTAETAPTTTLPVPEIEQSTHSEKFRDENGRIVYTVDVVVPHLDEFENTVLMAQVNTLSNEVFREACEKAELNIENAAKFMDSRNSATPWSRRIDFEVSFLNGRFLSFIIKEYFSSDGTEGEPAYRSATFDVLDGSPCYLTDFAPDTDRDDIAGKIIDRLLCPSVSSYFYGGQPLNEEQKQLVHDSFFYENFYLTADGVGFYMSSYVFNPQHSGVYTCHYTWDELSGIMALPE
ncbi:MAG: hypothetical protein IJD78_03300 [Clostridia bacterium]|nr:hypothetical protein [Clostridia bacterium]